MEQFSNLQLFIGFLSFTLFFSVSYSLRGRKNNYFLMLKKLSLGLDTPLLVSSSNKTVRNGNKSFIFSTILLLFVLGGTARATQIANDTFTSGSTDGWSVGYTWNNNGWLYIDRDDKAYKTYYFGTAYANTPITITVRFWVSSKWDHSDKFKVYRNNTKIKEYNNLDGYSFNVKTITSTTDSNGNFKLKFKPDSNKNNEYAALDYVKIEATTITADLSVQENISPSPSTATTNQDVDFNVHFQNNGPDTAAANITLVINYSLDVTLTTVPAGLTCNQSSGTLNVGSSLVCTYNLPVANGVTSDIATTVQALSVGNLTQTVSVSSPTLDPTAANNTVVSSPVTIINSCNGCDCSLDDNSMNSASPGAVIPTLDGALADVTTCISGSTSQAEGSPDKEDYYNFTVGATGTLSIVTTSPNSHNYHMQVLVNGAVHYADTTAQSHNIADLTLAAGDQVVVFFKETGSDLDEYQSTFTFQLATNTTAVDDTYSTDAGVILNVDALTGVLNNDTPSGDINVTAHTDPSNGTLTIELDGSFVYTPNASFSGPDTFTYTITNSLGNTDTATVTINVGETILDGLHAFDLVNPASTRNIRGDYKVAGNTVMCLTNKKTGNAYSGYGGTCQDSSYSLMTSNMRVSKYIDIDGDPTTWNSTSSYVVLPSTYDQNGGDGILWAGLFWQGRISTDNNYPMRFGVDNGSAPFGYTFTGADNTGYTLDIDTVDAEYIRLKIDSGGYARVKAKTMYRAASSGGTTYAAHADVTALLKGANLAQGKHVFTVANLVTNEGREPSPGVFGGWSLVVIYAEDFDGQPRNVSVYSGFDSIGTNSTPIEISGFKLPSAGNTVSAQLSVFSGEGEYRYGQRPGSTTKDWLKISDSSSSGFVDPGATNVNNTFDAHLDGVLRDAVPGFSNNLAVNNDGVDIDVFDVGSIVSGYSRAISSIFVKWYSNNDYITPSMMVFSTELYKPNLCYEYTFDIGGYQIFSNNNEVNTSLHLNNNQLTTHVAIRSREGDFPLNNVRFTAVSDPEYMRYQPGSARLAPNAILGYTPSSVFDIDNPTASSFTMNIGLGAGPGPGQGGLIEAFQTTYVRFNHEMNTSKSHIDTVMDMRIEYDVDYGSGPVPQVAFLTETCGGSGSYLPTYGTFNVERTAPTVTDAVDTDFNLYSQVSGREFELNLVAYKADDNYTRKTFSENVVLELEVVNANILGADADVQCHNPDGYGTPPEFIKIPAHQMSTPILAQQFDIARRNAVYRIWNLKADDGSLVQHECETEACFDSLYSSGSSPFSNDNSCTNECSPLATGCYDCLRKFHGKVTCSRDNFAVRPASYKIALYDSNNSVKIGANNTPAPYKVVAGYDYTYEVNATSYGSDNIAQGYRQGFPSTAWAGYSVNENSDMGAFMLSKAGIENNVSCNDKAHKKFPFSFWDGVAKNGEVPLRNVGNYKLHFLDNEWTAVDYANSNPNIGVGCLPNSNFIPLVTPSTDMVGCTVNSEYNASRGDLHIYAYPEHFDLGAVQYSTTNPNELFIYANTLGFGANNDSNMSINLLGEIEAQGADDNILNNFVTGCYAEELRLTLDSNTSPTTPVDVDGQPVQFRWLENSASGGNNTDRFTNQAFIQLVSSEFSKTLGGKTQLKLYVNFERPSNTEMNPFKFNLASLDVVCENGCVAYANGNPAFGIRGRGVYDKNVTVLYGRVNAPRRIVMCDSGSVGSSCTGEMDFYYEFYADADANSSMITDVVGPNPQRSSNSVNWYKNTVHAASDGEVKLTVQSNITASAPVTANGVTKIQYTYNGSKGYPYKENLNITSGTGVEPWLIYDKYNAAATQTSAHLEFYGPGKWTSTSGSNTTHSTKANEKKKTNRRIQW